MARYLLQRLAALLVVLFLISVFCLLLVHLVPGDPTSFMIGPSGDPHAKATLDAYLGLNRALPVQYWTWMVNLLHGNLGTSLVYGQQVSTMIAGSFKVDLELVVLSQLLAVAVAVPLSVRSARRAGGRFDKGATSVTFAFYCLPAYILIVWLFQLLSTTLHVVPGQGSDPFPSGLPLWDTVATNLHVMVLPAVVLALGSLAIYYRILRAEMIQTTQEEFITVARSKGLTTSRILWRHVLRPSSVPLLTSMGNSIALLLTGMFIVEDKMGLNGIGGLLINSISNNDYVTVQAIALVVAVTVVVVNFAIDVITTLVDPRIARA